MKRETDEYRGKGMVPGMKPGGDVGDDLGRISFGKQTFRSFKYPVFRILFGSLLGEMAAMNMQMLARSLLVYRLTGSATLLGVMSLVNALPMIGLSIFGGVIADRVQKKHVIFVGDVVSAVTALVIALALTVGYVSAENTGSWWVLLAAAVIDGAVFALMWPSRQTIIPEIVSNEELLNAVSLNMLGWNSLRLIAPVVAGFLIDNIGFAVVFYVMTGLYFMAAAFITLIPRTGTITISGRGALADIKEGLNYLRYETTILLILVFALITVVFSMPYMMLLPIFTEDILKVGASGLGILISVSGIGAIIGSFVLASLPNKKRGVVLLASSLILGVALVGFSFSSRWYLSLGLIVFVGLAQTGRMTLGNTLLQYYVKDEYRGRVMSIYMMEFGLSSLSAFAAGVLADAVGAPWAVGGFAIVLVILAILALVFLHQLRKLD